MAQMAESREGQRPQYPPPDDPNQGYYGQPQPSPQRQSPRDDRNSYPPPADPSRQGQYPPPHDPRAPNPYPPPQQWAGHPQYPPPQYHPHPAYGYPPPQPGQPPQPMQPDAYRLPPPYPPPHAYYPPPVYPQPAPAPAPRQRTAIACKYCRKRKIRCSGYDSSPDGRCQNCVRFNQQCLFHPVSSQAAFVPASAVYGLNARAPVAGQSGDGRADTNGQHYARPVEQPMLYGAHGQPLGPAGPQGQPQYGYPPPQGYPPPGHYPYPPHAYPPPPPGSYDPHAQPPAPPQSAHSDRGSLKRGPPDDENEDSNKSQSPHPASRPRNSAYDARQNSSGGYEYPEPSSMAPTSPATSTMSYQSFPTQSQYTNGNQTKTENVSNSALTPQSAHGYNSPHGGHGRDESKTTPPAQTSSAGSSANGRSGMKVHEMLGNSNAHASTADQRGRNDSDMLSKLDGKK